MELPIKCLQHRDLLLLLLRRRGRWTSEWTLGRNSKEVTFPTHQNRLSTEVVDRLEHLDDENCDVVDPDDIQSWLIARSSFKKRVLLWNPSLKQTAARLG